MTTLPTLGPDDPVTFKEAAEILLRGLVTASTLATAAKRGELETERLGRRIVTTPDMVKRWRERCSRPASAKLVDPPLRQPRGDALDFETAKAAALLRAERIINGTKGPSPPLTVAGVIVRSSCAGAGLLSRPT